MSRVWWRSITTLLGVLLVMGLTVVLALPTEAKKPERGGPAHCQGDDVVRVSYGIADDIRYVESIRLDGLARECRHTRIHVTLLDDQDDVLTAVTYDGPHSGGTAIVQLDDLVSAAALHHVSLNIGGARSN